MIYSFMLLPVVATTSRTASDNAKLLNVLGLYIVVKLIDDFIIQPATIGRSVKLHPMLLIISILAGQKLFGILGMILAVPAVTILQKIVQILLDHRKRMRSRTTAPIHIQKIIV